MPTELDELRQLLEQLRDQTEAIRFSQLYGLSDLAGESLGEFCAAWDTFPTAQRRRLSNALAELAEASFQVHFDAIFCCCLDDPDAQVRAVAIDGLWENEQVALIGPLVTMLRTDPSARVRAAAAAGLGRFVLAGQLEQLNPPVQVRIMIELMTAIHLTGESIEVRRRAIESAAYACTPEVLDALEMAYHDDDELMRLSAIAGMGRSCDKRWRDILLTELESPTAAMRYEAALASGELMLRETVPVLARLIDDADHQVRDAVICALGQIGGSQAKQVLIAAYDDADDDSQSALGDALAELALIEGDLDVVPYPVIDDMDDDLLDDELFSLRAENDEAEDEADLNDWS